MYFRSAIWRARSHFTALNLISDPRSTSRATIYAVMRAYILKRTQLTQLHAINQSQNFPMIVRWLPPSNGLGALIVMTAPHAKPSVQPHLSGLHNVEAHPHHTTPRKDISPYQLPWKWSILSIDSCSEPFTGPLAPYESSVGECPVSPRCEAFKNAHDGANSGLLDISQPTWSPLNIWHVMEYCEETNFQCRTRHLQTNPADMLCALCIEPACKYLDVSNKHIQLTDM